MHHPFHTILAMDSACGPCSVAVLSGGNLLAYRREEQTTRQAALLVPMVEAAMNEAGLGYSGLSAIISTVGPGSFTGLRISLSAALGIGLATGIPVHGATTLAACAYASHIAHPAETVIAPVLNAGKGEVYCQRFHAAPFAPMDAPVICAPGVLPAPAFHTHELPDARALALMAYHHPEQLAAPEPLYIRPPDAKPMAARA